MTIDVSRHRCLILGTDGLWNMIPPQRAVEVVQTIDRQNKMHSNSEHPLVRKIKDNLFILGINFLFIILY